MRTLTLIAAAFALAACSQQADDTQTAEQAAEEAAAASAETLAQAPDDTHGVVLIQYRSEKLPGSFIIAQCGPVPEANRDAFRESCMEHVSHMRLDDGRVIGDLLDRETTDMTWQLIEGPAGLGSVVETRIVVREALTSGTDT